MGTCSQFPEAQPILHQSSHDANKCKPSKNESLLTIFRGAAYIDLQRKANIVEAILYLHN